MNVLLNGGHGSDSLQQNVQFFGITSLIQTAENKKFVNNHVQFIPILNRAIQYIMIHGLLLFRKIRKNIQRTKRTLFYLKMLTLPILLR